VFGNTHEALVLLLAGLTASIALIGTTLEGPPGTLIGVTLGLGLVGASHASQRLVAAVQPALVRRGHAGASS
jgi:hypothetical protein